MKLKRKLIGVSAVVLVAVSCVSYYNLNNIRLQNQTLQAEEDELLSKIERSKKSLQDSLEKAKSLDITRSQVDNGDVITNLNNLISSSGIYLKESASDTPVKEWYAVFLEEKELEKNSKSNKDLLSSLDKRNKGLTSAISSVKKSKLTKDVEVAKEDLSKVLASAKDELVISEGNVFDEGVRDALSSEITKIESVLSGDTVSSDFLSSITSCKKTLQTKIEDVDVSIEKQEKVLAEQERERKERELAYQVQQAAQSTSSQESTQTQSQNSDNAWHANYTSGIHSYDLGSGLVKWEEGYYVAHSNTESGQTIASTPSSVVVDGVSYHYVSSIQVSPDTTWDEVQGFVQANGGIGFQTCQGNGNYLITHYEPD